MSSGILPTTEVIDACYDVMKKKKAWAISSFNKDRTKVVLLATGDAGSSFQEFKDNFPKNKALFAVYECNYSLGEGGERSKVLAINFSDDDDCPRIEKMLVASTTDAMKKKCFAEAAKVAEIKAYDEIDEENFINIVSENKTK